MGEEGRRGRVEQLHVQHRFIVFIISDMVRTIAMAPWRESTVYVTIVSATMDMGISDRRNIVRSKQSTK